MSKLSWVPDELDPLADHVREVYAHYGLAMYAAQLLEHELVTFCVVSRTEAGSFGSYGERDTFEAQLSTSTMGRQLRAAIAEGRLDVALGEQLETALGTRNRLAHRYFRERSAEMMSERGRDLMLDELDRMRDELGAADEALTAVTRELMARQGVTAELIEAVLVRARRELDEAELTQARDEDALLTAVANQLLEHIRSAAADVGQSPS